MNLYFIVILIFAFGPRFHLIHVFLFLHLQQSSNQGDKELKQIVVSFIYIIRGTLPALTKSRYTMHADTCIFITYLTCSLYIFPCM